MESLNLKHVGTSCFKLLVKIAAVVPFNTSCQAKAQLRIFSFLFHTPSESETFDTDWESEAARKGIRPLVAAPGIMGT
jgi:hypothetical protein